MSTASQIQALMNKVGDDYGMQSQIQDITKGMDSDTLTKFGNTLDMCIKGGTHEGFLAEMQQAKTAITNNLDEARKDIDRSGDHKFSPKEVQSYNNKMAPQGMAPLAVPANTSSFDGLINEQLKSSLKNVEMRDTNKNGAVEYAEIPDALKGAPNIPPPGAGLGIR